MTGLTHLEWIKLAIYYASYLYFFVAPFLIWLSWRRCGWARIAALLALAPLTALAYARFIEPRILLTVEHDVVLDRCQDKAGAFRVAVFSDLHRGLFGNAIPLTRIMRTVNAAQPDISLFAGDYIYFLSPVRFENEFEAFADLEAPLFAVLGNHDIGLPGPNVSDDLERVLPHLGVILIDNSTRRIVLAGNEIELVGVSDNWGGRQDLSLLQTRMTLPRIVLTHNASPTAASMRPGMEADLFIGGHTHGGQIYLPFITCWHTGACGDARLGLRRAYGTQIFTTSGTGMVGLPMRFAVIPRVDVLNVRYNKCAVG